jgi:hypothetical protein
MATIKIKHYVLFFLLFGIFRLTDFPGGALVAFILWMQLCILLWRKEYSFLNQKVNLAFALSLVPALLVWGAINSFFFSYSAQSHWLFSLFYGLISFALCSYLVLFSIFGFAQSGSLPKASTTSAVLSIYATGVAQLRKYQSLFLWLTTLVYLLSLVPWILPVDYKITLALVVGHLALRWRVDDQN